MYFNKKKFKIGRADIIYIFFSNYFGYHDKVDSRTWLILMGFPKLCLSPMMFQNSMLLEKGNTFRLMSSDL